MNSFTKQNLFTQNNCSRFYLSPYCKVFKSEDSVLAEREDIKSKLFFSNTKPENVLKLFEHLRYGMAENELIHFLENTLNEPNSKNWIKQCIQGGILE